MRADRGEVRLRGMVGFAAGDDESQGEGHCKGVTGTQWGYAGDLKGFVDQLDVGDL